jgi:type IV secretory pathway VirB2 component (pilin)
MRYNYATFMQTVPVITIIVFGISVLSGMKGWVGDTSGPCN